MGGSPERHVARPIERAHLETHKAHAQGDAIREHPSYKRHSWI